MRIQTLIVKCIFAVACLLIPSEVLAAENGKSDDHPKPPVQNLDLPDPAENSENGNLDQEKSSDHGQNQKDEHANTNATDNQGVDVNINAEVHSQNSNGEEKRSLHVDVNNGKESSNVQADVNKQKHGKKKSDKVDKSTDSLEKGDAEHSDHSQVGQQKKGAIPPVKYTDENVPATTDQKPKTGHDTDNLKSSTDKVSQQKDPKPIPTDSDKTPQPTPVVIPAQHVLNLSKSSGQNGDGQSSTSGNGFTFYGIASFGDGPLMTLVNDYSNELKRKNNQWINAPPSPPPKSNLLSQ